MYTFSSLADDAAIVGASRFEFFVLIFFFGLDFEICVFGFGGNKGKGREESGERK